MRICFLPQRRDGALTLEKSNGNRLRINGEMFNFNPLTPGDIIPEGEVPCEYLRGPVEHVNGHVTLTLVLPLRPNAPYEMLFPEPIIVDADGPIILPMESTNVDA